MAGIANEITLTIFICTVGAESLSVAGIVLSLLFPRWRIWPPSRNVSWGSYIMWLLFFISGSGTVLLGILDRGSIPCAPWARWAIGAPLWMAGMGMAVWAIIVLGYATTFGSEGQIACQGPYRFSRNPQYVGFAAALIGWAILTGSKLTFISALVGTMAFLLAPFAEEPWLEEKYGKKYAEYKRKVPRFLFQKKQKR